MIPYVHLALTKMMLKGVRITSKPAAENLC